MGRRGWGVGELGKTGMISFRTTGTGNVNRGDKSPLAFIAISAFPGLEEHALCKCLLGLGTWNLAVKPGLRSRWSSPNCHFKPIVSKEAITGRAVGVGPPVQPEEKPTRKETNKPFPSSTAWRDSQSGCNDQDASSSALAKTFILSIQHWLPHQFRSSPPSSQFMELWMRSWCVCEWALRMGHDLDWPNQLAKPPNPEVFLRIARDKSRLKHNFTSFSGLWNLPDWREASWARAVGCP